MTDEQNQGYWFEKISELGAGRAADLQKEFDKRQTELVFSGPVPDWEAVRDLKDEFRRRIDEEIASKPSGIEAMYTSFKKAQADYSREQFVKSTVSALCNPRRPEVLADKTVEDLRQRLMKTRAKQDTDFESSVEEIAADPDLTEDERRARYERLWADARRRLGEDIEDIGAAFEEAETRLTSQADPFNNEKSESKFSRYLLEMQATGGPGRKDEIVKTVEAVASGYDEGALMFWSRNFEKVFDSAAQPRSLKMGVEEMLRAKTRLRKLLDGAVAKRRDGKQSDAARQLSRVRQWQADLENTIGVAQLVSKSNVVVPIRKRTPQEQIVANKKKELAWAQAQVDELSK